MPIVTLQQGKSFEVKDGATLLDAALAAGLVLEHGCRTGRCGTCRAPVLEGRTRAVRSEESLSAGDAAAGVVLTCARTAETDVTLDLEDLGELAGIPVRTLPARLHSIEKLAPEDIRTLAAAIPLIRRIGEQ